MAALSAARQRLCGGGGGARRPPSRGVTPLLTPSSPSCSSSPPPSSRSAAALVPVVTTYRSSPYGSNRHPVSWHFAMRLYTARPTNAPHAPPPTPRPFSGPIPGGVVAGAAAWPAEPPLERWWWSPCACAMACRPTPSAIASTTLLSGAPRFALISHIILNHPQSPPLEATSSTRIQP